jgi:mannose-6-phosphate isomerase-like protein (cupin superfamily)
MEIKNRKDIKPLKDACESLQEMHHSQNMSISYATITQGSKPHKHLRMEEVYYIVKGNAKMKIGSEIFDIKAGDIIPIPKGIYHNIESVESTIELVVVTHPRFDPKDLIY